MSTPIDAFGYWRKSSFSNGGDNCLEVSAPSAGGLVGIRDSKLSDDSPVLVVASSQWRELLIEIRSGR